MVQKIRLADLPIEDAQPDDTVAAYRAAGNVVRVRIASGGEDGTVTSVGVSMPLGFEVSNSPVTTSGTITVTFAAGFGLPTTVDMGAWSTAYSWGDHSLAGYALASAVTSALAGKVDTSDVRLSDSREWSASTVTQATAEAGTSTVRFAWTAQRVRQAVVAWWSTVTGVFGRTLAGAETAADARAALALGSAATANTSSFATAGQGANADVAYGWGNHASAGYATTSALASGLAGKVGVDDVRLSDAREWSASTVTQETAEAGTNTSRFAWTAQRVRQNVAAYTYDKPTIVAMVTDDANKNFTWIATTTALTANAANKVNFSSQRTLTLPGTPAENEYVIILRTAGSMLGSVIARNGQTIMGVAENMTVDSNISYLRLDFVDGSWRISS